MSGFFSLFPSIMLPMFLAMVDGTIVSAALPAIAGELGEAQRISWIVIAYLIAATVASPVYGRLGDSFGRKRLMYVALVIIIVATVLCGLAPNVDLLIAARVLQGLGGGGLMTLSQALIGEAVPPRERARYQGFLASVAVFSNAFGAVVGGVLTESFGWRSIFFVSAPVGLLAMLLLLRMPALVPKREPFRFDVGGLVLFVVFITSTLVMFHQIQTFTLAVLPVVVGLLALGVAAAILLVWRERRASSPLFPIALFNNPTIWRSDALALCHGAALVSLITFLPIYLRVGLGWSAGAIGLSLLPVTVSVPSGSILTGIAVSRTGYTAIFPSVGLIFATAVLVAVGVLLPHLDGVQLSFLLGLAGLFMGTVMGVVQVTVQSAAGAGMLGTASASVQFSRSTGAALGTALVGVVLFATMTAMNPNAGQSLAMILERGADALASMSAAQIAAIEAEIGTAFRVAFFTIAGFVATANVLAWSIPLRRI
jgi:MFS family permease